MNTLAIFGALWLSVSSALGAGNENIRNFDSAKKHALRIHEANPYTLYCNCHYFGKKVDLESCGYKVPHDQNQRAKRIEWEHVVPAEAFGNSFVEWREGAPQCTTKSKKFKGRKCAETNPEFNKMEADLYNLWPEVGQLNALRSNFSMAEISESSEYDFGECKAKIRDRKFEPMDSAKGIVARVYMYMDANYPGRGVISDKNQKLFEAWDRMYPVQHWECQRAELISKIQGNVNEIVRTRCHNK